ncbi:hypothetical protein K450DRAFT_281407 [Umbelopsis ramanniana AG]|uniref:Uncharacterized protein n=1 Tax=Umbelopsis ramanniana AG TaxID=1314678 RepID=A0AAD5HC11_UMBRA|nr:uncharacterized protein K450DRAFT_281407 [Umbelopsis ramanniana AG]KAI8578730.1 hypothetical protein K450DRAFT_281407 [Umbelopsis ramanniana AG]
MSIVLTKTCQHAIVIVIRSGSKLPLVPSSTFFIECEIDLKLPSSVNDLLPPSTLIKSQLNKNSLKSNWSTTLTYCLSAKLLNYLVKQDATLHLKICPTTPTDRHCPIFDMSLRDAKYLQDTGDASEVQQYLEQGAPYIPVLKKCNLELQCGLFVVDMPEKLESNLQNMHTIHPQILQSGANDTSIMDATESTETVYSADHSEDSLLSHITGDFSTISKSSAASSIQPTYHQIGNGRDLHTLYFNLVSTNCTIPLSKTNAANGKEASKSYFQYRLFGERCRINIHEGAAVGNAQMHFQVRGDRHDILNWLNSQGRMRISICIEDSYGQEVEIGHSMIALANIFVPIVPDGKQSFYNRAPNRNVPVYDHQNRLVLQSKTSISSLNIQAGLFPNWVYNEEAEAHGDKPIFHFTENIHHQQTGTRLNDQDIISTHLSSSSAYPRSPSRVLHKFIMSKEMSNNENRTPLQDAQAQSSKSMIPRCRRSYTCSR